MLRAEASAGDKPGLRLAPVNQGIGSALYWSPMSLQIRIALVGDHNPAVIAHQAIPVAVELAAADLGVRAVSEWVPTAKIGNAATDLASYQAIWCVPASPYENMQGALDAIQFAREKQLSFLGTCAGFQHALIEYARNVLGMKDTDHAETNPAASQPFISRLSCSLVEVQSEILLVPDSILHRSYGTLKITEGYHCNYGPSRECEGLLFNGEFRVTARDAAGEVRGGELTAHPFFVGTLFQPERRALKGEAPPIVREFVRAVSKSA
jgi:CTP synthase (UTP-ammonia lyase)